MVLGWSNPSFTPFCPLPAFVRVTLPRRLFALSKYFLSDSFCELLCGYWLQIYATPRNQNKNGSGFVEPSFFPVLPLSAFLRVTLPWRLFALSKYFLSDFFCELLWGYWLWINSNSRNQNKNGSRLVEPIIYPVLPFTGIRKGNPSEAAFCTVKVFFIRFFLRIIMWILIANLRHSTKPK